MSRGVLRLVAATVATVAACSQSPSSPTPLAPPRPVVDSPYAGTWSGTITDDYNGSGTLRLVLAANFAANETTALTGEWTSSFPDATRNSRGVATLFVVVNRASLLMSPTSRPACAIPVPPAGEYVASELLLGPASIRGTYVFGACGASVTGTMGLMKE